MTNKVFEATMENLETRISDIALPDITLKDIQEISDNTIFDRLSHWAIFYNSKTGKIWLEKYPMNEIDRVYDFPDIIEIDNGYSLRLPVDIMSAIYDSLLWLTKRLREELI